MICWGAIGSRDDDSGHFWGPILRTLNASLQGLGHSDDLLGALNTGFGGSVTPTDQCPDLPRGGLGLVLRVSDD